MAIASIRQRYQYLRFMYTCLFEASISGTTCFDPLFFHYPTLAQAYEHVEHTFIVGDAIKVSPILQTTNNFENQTFESFFPRGDWVSLNNIKDVV